MLLLAGFFDDSPDGTRAAKGFWMTPSTAASTRNGNNNESALKLNLKLGRILGIDVYLHVTFLLLLGLIASAHAVAGGSLAAGLNSVTFLAAIFLCVLLHEFGHALMARRYGIQTLDITLLPIGGVARLERMPNKPVQELWVALAGPGVNVVIAAVLAAWLTMTSSWSALTSLSSTSGPFAERLLVVNVMLVLFNLLPAFPMDGGRVLRALLATRLDYARATRIAARTGQVMAVVFVIAGLFSNPFLLLIAFFVWMGAVQENRSVQVRAGVSGHAVGAAMLTQFTTLGVYDRLERAVELVMAGWQQDFPVMEEDRVVGVLTREDLMAALKTGGLQGLVCDVMRREFVQVDESELLEAVMFDRKALESTVVPVMRDRRLVGLLTAENLGEFLTIQSALNPNRTTV